MANTYKYIMALTQNALRSTKRAPRTAAPTHPKSQIALVFVADGTLGVHSFMHGKQRYFLLSSTGRPALVRLASTFVNCPDELDRLKSKVNRYEPCLSERWC